MRVSFKLLNILIGLVIIIFISCYNTNDITSLKKKHPELSQFIDSLTNKNLIYTKCVDCSIPFYHNETFQGYTNRNSKGIFLSKKLTCKKFKYEAYEYSSQKKEGVKGCLLFCFMNDKQAKDFKNFTLYYENINAHHKEPVSIHFTDNIAIINHIYFP